jgi:hypothetical protein
MEKDVRDEREDKRQAEMMEMYYTQFVAIMYRRAECCSMVAK